MYLKKNYICCTKGHILVLEDVKPELTGKKALFFKDLLGVVRVDIFCIIRTNNLFQEPSTSKFSVITNSFHCEYQN